MIPPYSKHPRLDGFPPDTQLPQQGNSVAEQTGHPPVVGLGVTGGGVWLGGLGGDGGGGPSPGHSRFHQHRFPPFPQLVPSPSLTHWSAAVDPSAQIVAARGSFLAHKYIATVEVGEAVVGSVVGTAVGVFVGASVGD